MPSPAAAAGNALHAKCLEHFLSLHHLDEDGEPAPEARIAESRLTKVIAQTRAAVLDMLRQLE
jgi:hypothetical protein